MLQPLQICVKESLQELRLLQRRHPGKHKVMQMLIAIKKHGSLSKDKLSAITGASDKSIHIWRKVYISGGMELLLKERRGGNKPGRITSAIHNRLAERLHNPKEGFRSFIEIQQWLQTEFGIEMQYHAVNKYVKRKFGARLKVSRKSHVQKSPLTKRFLKNLFEKLEHIKIKYKASGCTTANLYFQDESRFGLLTVLRRMITAKGVKPVAPFLHRFDNLYLFGAFSPITGDCSLLEMPNCNSYTFQFFIDQMAAKNPSEFKILILDNGAFHHARSLVIPKSMTLIFLPPYSPELNPAEKMWRYFKDRVSMIAYPSLNILQEKITSITNQINNELVMSICGNDFYKTTFKSSFNV